MPEATQIPDLATLQGRLLRRGDPGYEQARTVFNGAIDRRPLIVARCTTPRRSWPRSGSPASRGWT